MQIHQIQEFKNPKTILDPSRGLVLTHERVLKQSSTSAIAFDGVTYEIGEDGSFDVPDEVGQYYVGRPGWYEGPNPFAEQPSATASPFS